MTDRLRPMVKLMLIPTVIGILWFYAQIRAHPMEQRLVDADAALFRMVAASAPPETADGRQDPPDDSAARDFEAYAADLTSADVLAHTSADADAIP